MNWEENLDRFACYQRAAGLSERTIKSRAEVLGMLAARSQRRPQLVDHVDMVDHLNRQHARTGGKLSPGTKQVERSYLQVWGRWMVLEGYLAHNPSDRLPKVRVPRRMARPLRIQHIEALLESGIRQSTQDQIGIAATTGLRIGEVVRIHGRDYDPRTQTLRAVRKGGITHYLLLPELALDIANRMPRNGWWFPSPYSSRQFPDGGGHILMKSASTKITLALRRTGINDTRITAHSLRHYFACSLIANEVPLHVVQELMGHASIATTQLYLEVSDTEVHDAVSKVPYIGRRVTPQSGNSQLLVA